VKSGEKAAGESRKQAISIRMSRADVRNVKRLAERLGARDSDVIRFAIKMMLAKLSPLQDLTVVGRSLVPVFVEWGSELMRHFELDAATLSTIINEGVTEERRVDPNDIQLIAISGIQRSFATARAPGMPRNRVAVEGRSTARPSGKTLVSNAGQDDDEGSDDRDVQRYLLEKYLGFRASSPNNESGESS